MSAEIPTKADFQLWPVRGQDLDRWSAWEHFGGRTMDEAYAVFRENALHYQEDLMWMAPKPFCFYLPVALRYLQAEESSGEIVNILAEDIEHHFKCEEDIAAAFPCIQAICDYVLSQSKFDIDDYGDLQPKYEALRRKVCERGEAPDGGPNAS